MGRFLFSCLFLSLLVSLISTTVWFQQVDICVLLVANTTNATILQTAGMYKPQITLFFIFLINSSGLSLAGCNEHAGMRLCLANGATVQGPPDAARH